MQTYVEFRSRNFPPYEGEEDAVNPGRFGKRLAEFLQRGLREKGFEAEAPVAEDWGWRVPIRHDGCGLWIGCGNYDEYPEDGFLCFIEAHTRPMRRFLRKVDVAEVVGKLREAMEALLAGEPGIRERRWWTAEEFGRRGREGG